MLDLRARLPGVLAVALAFAFPALARPQQPPGADKPLNEDWTGPLAIPGGAEVKVAFHVRDVRGRLTATLDVPAQGLFDAPATITVAGRRVQLSIPALKVEFEGELAADRVAGRLVQAGLAAPLELQRQPAPLRPQTPQPPFPYASEPVSFANAASGFALAGELTLPRGPGPFPAALLISGSGSQDRDETVGDHRPFWVLADRLTREGFAVLRLDDRGIGGSGGRPGSATLADLAGDAAAGVAFLRARPEIDPARVGLLGHSEGANIAALAAARDPRIAFVVMLAGMGVSGRQELLLQTAALARARGADEATLDHNRKLNTALYAAALDAGDAAAAATAVHAAAIGGGASEAVAQSAARALSTDAMRDFMRYDPATALRGLNAPVLALNGGKDLQVPAQENLSGLRAALDGNPRVTTQTLPGLNHLFQTADTGLPREYPQIEETFSPTALSLISRWMHEQAGAPRR